MAGTEFDRRNAGINAVRAQQRLTDWIDAQAVAKDQVANDARVLHVMKALQRAIDAAPDLFTPRGSVGPVALDVEGGARAALAVWNLN